MEVFNKHLIEPDKEIVNSSFGFIGYIVDLLTWLSKKLGLDFKWPEDWVSLIQIWVSAFIDFLYLLSTSWQR